MWIEIFRTGTFTDSKGRTQTFTESDLERIARQYNERVEGDASFEAPLVKGHPQSNSPAFGWVERLARRGNVLYAKLKSLSKEIIDEINEGRYRRVSISLFPDLMLRHIGLLGAETPAVKGLRPISFVEFDESVVFEYANETRDFAELEQEIRRLESENHDLARQNEALHEQLQKAYHESLAQRFREFVRRLNESSDYILIPPKKEQELVNLLEYAAKADEIIRSAKSEKFPEGYSFVDNIQRFFEEFRPVAIKQEFTHSPEQSIEFDEKFDGKKVDEKRLVLHHRARELQRKNPELSYEQALLLANKS
ncbi:MAG: hypothetical protein ACPLX7_09665 [Candidatus Kapaibacteriota bacterium]|jgi:Skp family chaperone for outer membrane proteins